MGRDRRRDHPRQDGTRCFNSPLYMHDDPRRCRPRHQTISRTFPVSGIFRHWPPVFRCDSTFRACSDPGHAANLASRVLSDAQVWRWTSTTLMAGVPFPRPLKLGDQGIDVEGLGRALCKAGVYISLEVFRRARSSGGARSASARRTRSTSCELAQGWRRTGVYNEPVHDLMEKAGYFDARAIDLIKRWKPPPPPKEPQIRAAMSDFCRTRRGQRGEVALHPAPAVLGHRLEHPSVSTTAIARPTACSSTHGRRRPRASTSPIPRATTSPATATPGTTSTGTGGCPRRTSSATSRTTGSRRDLSPRRLGDEAVFSSFGSERGPHRRTATTAPTSFRLPSTTTG